MRFFINLLVANAVRQTTLRLSGGSRGWKQKSEAEGRREKQKIEKREKRAFNGLSQVVAYRGLRVSLKETIR